MVCEAGKTPWFHELLKASADRNILGMDNAHRDLKHLRPSPLHLAV